MAEKGARSVKAKKPLSVVEYLALNHMWIFACMILPLSIAYDLVYNSVLKVSYLFGRGARAHDEKVKDVQAQVRAWIASGMKTHMCTARPSWKSISPQSFTYKSRLHLIRINMPDIISLDEDKKTVRVEPSVTIGQLNDFLIGDLIDPSSSF